MPTKAELRSEIRDLIDDPDEVEDRFSEDELVQIAEVLHDEPGVGMLGHLRYEVTIYASSYTCTDDVARSTVDIAQKGPLQKDELVGVRDAIVANTDDHEEAEA